MVLVLKNDQMENLLPMSEEIDAIEQAFRELGEGKAMNAPRARLRTPWKEEGGQYYFNNIMGLVPGVKSMALRIDSSFSKDVEVAGSKRRVYPGDYIGLVMLFDMDTCEILAMMDDHLFRPCASPRPAPSPANIWHAKTPRSWDSWAPVNKPEHKLRHT